MENKTINIELKPVIFAHHHEYRIVAQCENVSQAVIDKLQSSKYDLYFTEIEHKQEESIKPIKYRFFSFHIERDSKQPKTCYVLARLEPRQDIVTHRGLVSAVQFFIIEGEQTSIFEKDFHANAAYLLAKIRFLNFDLTKLSPGEIVKMSPVTLSVKQESLEIQVEELKGNPVLPELQPLFVEEVIRALDQERKIFVYSKRFSDPVEVFNVYCRTLFTALIDSYRKKISFTTSELTTNINDYNLVFLHNTANTTIDSKKAGILFVSLDNPNPGKKIFWYLDNKHINSLFYYHRFLSQRIVQNNFHTIDILEPYCKLMLNLDENTSGDKMAKVVEYIDKTLGDLDGRKIFEDYKKFLDRYFPKSRFDNNSRSIFRSFYRVASNAYESGSWPEQSRIEFDNFVISWVEDIVNYILSSRYDFFQSLEAIEDLKDCDRNLRYRILKTMLINDSGLGCLIKKDVIPNLTTCLKAWNVLVNVCHEELTGDKPLLSKIWKNIKHILETIDSEGSLHDSFSITIAQLSDSFCKLFINERESIEMHFKIFETLLTKQLHTTFIPIFIDFMKAYGIYDWVPDHVQDLLRNRFYTLCNDAQLMTFSHELLQLSPDLAFNFVPNTVEVISRLSLNRVNIRDTIRDKFIFNGNEVSRDHSRQLLRGVEPGVITGQIYNAFEDEIKIQKELLTNLNISALDSITLNVRGYYFSINAPEFEKRAPRLSARILSDFFNNLSGFVKDKKLEGSLLPVFWSYLKIAPDVDGAERCFDTMINYLYESLFRSWQEDFFDKKLFTLCRDVYKIPCDIIEESDLPITSPWGKKNYLNEKKYDSDHIFLQLAAATQSKESRIEKFVNKFLNVSIPRKKKWHVAGIVLKYYVSPLPGDYIQFRWKERLEKIIEEQKRFNW